MKNKKPKEEPEKKAEEEEDKEEVEQEEEKAKTTRLIEDAHLAAKRLEEANKVMAANITRMEALQAEAALGGKTEAAAPKKTKEQQAVDAANNFLAGTGLDINEPAGDVKFTK